MESWDEEVFPEERSTVIYRMLADSFKISYCTQDNCTGTVCCVLNVEMDVCLA